MAHDDVDTVINSLEQSAETGIDLTDEIYASFFVRCEAAADLMGHSDQHMRGRMLDQIFEILMNENLDDSYFQWEIENHLNAYGVRVDMYDAFLTSVRDAVQASLGASWNDSYSQAWNDRIETVLGALDSHAR